jgi:CRISPR-associated endonuclease Cas1/CRISPR-associated protein Cas4
MLNQYAYCPRLFHFMHVEGRWEDNQFTVEGRHAHRRVDELDHLLPEADSTDKQKEAKKAKDSVEPPAGDEPPVIARSVPLSSDSLGLSAKLDLVSTDGAEAVPVETKRGRVPDNAQRSWKPERVQLMAQGLLLREQGYACDHGMLYFAGSRTRVRVDFTPELESRTRQLLDEAHRAVSLTVLPPPLEDSPKCVGCSLAGICLPDETNALLHAPADAPAGAPAELPADGQPLRRLYPVRDEALPLYVQEQGAYVSISKKRLVVKKAGEELASAKLQDIAHLVLCGNIQISTQAVHVLCESSIPIVYLSTGHWFYGIAHGIHLRNAFDRVAQFQFAADASRCLSFAKHLIAQKAENQRTFIRRNSPADADSDRTVNEIDHLIEQIPKVESIQSLLGIEGSIAAAYFGRFSTLLRPRDFDAQWDFSSRNRRPPRDPVNALLSFGYAMLAKECTVALLSEGLDPWWGLYHQPRHGRPALALDIMEPFRPAIVDSAVISAINTGMVQRASFDIGSSACILKPEGRKAFIRAYESRLDQLITHPVFDYRCSWRVVIRLQARLLSRWFRGEIPNYTGVTTR